MKMFQDMTAKRNWESLGKLQMKDGMLSTSMSGNGSERGHSAHGHTSSSGILAAAVAHHGRRNGGGDESDEESNPRRRTAGSSSAVNLLDALQGLNKMVSKQKRRDDDERAGGGKKTSIDQFLKKQSNMNKSKSQGML